MIYVDHNAKNYADALFMLSEELNETEALKSDLLTVCDSIDKSPEFLKLLDTPSIPREERIDLVEKAFGTLNRNIVNLIKILSERRLTYLIHKIRDAYMVSYDISRNIERVEAITFVPLSENQIVKLQHKLENLTGKQIIVENTIDPSILGGMKLRYMGVQIDGSIQSKLDSFEKSLKDLVI